MRREGSESERERERLREGERERDLPLQYTINTCKFTAAKV